MQLKSRVLFVLPFVLAALPALAQAQVTCQYWVTPTSIPTFSYAGGSATVTVNSYQNSETGLCTGGSWSASAGFQSWISVSPGSGTGPGPVSVTVTVTANTNASRSGSVTIAGRTITITQTAYGTSSYYPCGYSFTPTSLPTFSAAGGTAILTVNSTPADCTGGYWSASTTNSYIRVSPTFGSGPGQFSVTVTVDPNGGTSRFGAGVSIASGSIAINQAGTTTATCTYSVTPISLSFLAAGGAQSVTVSSSPVGCTGGSWSVGTIPPGILVSPGSGAGPGPTSVTVTALPLSLGSWTGGVSIAGQFIAISQAGPTSVRCTYSVAPTSLAFPAAGGSANITLTSSPANCTGGSWTAVPSDYSWISVPSPKGEGPGPFTFAVTVAPNTGTSSRAGSIAIAGQTIAISQAAPTPTALCTYTVTPTSLEFGAAAGSASFTVISAPANCTGGTWSASPSDYSWISVSPTYGGGPGSSSVTVTVASNTGARRTGIVYVTQSGAGQTVTINQAAGPTSATCNYTVNRTSVEIPVIGGSQGFTVSSTPANCTGGSWSASWSTYYDWMNLPGQTQGSGPGPFEVLIYVLPNSGPRRTGSLTIAGQTVTISQTGVDQIIITTNSLPPGIVNVAYGSQPLQAQGGTAPYAWTAQGLPAGLSLTAEALSGTPTAAGTFSVTVTVTDNSTPKQTASNTYSLTILPGLTITSAALPNGTVGVAYAQVTMQAQGGTAPFTWTAQGLPPGLSLAGGVLSGTPTAAGTFSVTVTVTDNSTPKQSAPKTYSLTILPGLTITTAALPNGTVGVAYAPVAMQAQGGTAPYTWTAQGLPVGLSLSLTAGALGGTPTTAGNFTLTITVTDSSTPTPLTNSRQFSLTVAPNRPVASCPSAAASATFGTAYTVTCTASGGVPPYVWAATGLPANLQIDPNTGRISGTPAALGRYSASVTATDSLGQASVAVPVSWAIVLPNQAITLNLVSQVQSPTDQPTLNLSLANTAPALLTGTLTLTFTPDASVTNLLAGYINPAVVFWTKGTTLDFTIPADSKTAVLPANGQFSQGTVAGVISVQVTALNAAGSSVLPGTLPQPQTVKIAPSAPVIIPNGVKITNVTATGFSVEVDGYSTTRELTRADFAFAAAAGAQLDGATAFVEFKGADQIKWFALQESRPHGGNFGAMVPFAYSGDAAALGTVTVTLTNSKGSSASATGGR